MPRNPVFHCRDCPQNPAKAKVVYTDATSKKQFCMAICRANYALAQEDKERQASENLDAT